MSKIHDELLEWQNGEIEKDINRHLATKPQQIYMTTNRINNVVETKYYKNADRTIPISEKEPNEILEGKS